MHDAALIALRREDVESGLAHQVVPFRKRAGVLREVVRTRWNQAVDATRLGFRAAGIGNKEDDGVAAGLLELGCDGIAQQALASLEACDELVPVVSIKMLSDCRLHRLFAPSLVVL